MIRKIPDLNLRRYSLPGLKKWILLGILGFLFGLLGTALLLDLRPVTRLRDLLWLLTEQIAKLMPTYVSGTLAIGLCIIFISYALMNANKEVVRAIAPEFADRSVLDALDKLHSLSRGTKVVKVIVSDGIDTVEWLIDGKLFEKVQSPFTARWPLVPGQHRFSIRTHLGVRSLESVPIRIKSLNYPVRIRVV